MSEKDRKELMEWVNQAPVSCLWPLVLFADCVDSKFWGDFTIGLQAGIPQLVRKSQTLKPE